MDKQREARARGGRADSRHKRHGGKLQSRLGSLEYFFRLSTDHERTMLRAKSLPEFLEQANTDGMRATMLLQADGAVQGAAGKGITALHGQIMGVVSTQMWGEFNGAEMESGTGDLEMILMGMDTGTLGVARLRTGHLICVYAEEWVKLGNVRSRLIALRSALEESLRSLEEAG